MTRAAAIEYFGSVRVLADALGISTQAIYQWGEMVPELMAYKIEVLTQGALRAVGP